MILVFSIYKLQSQVFLFLNINIKGLPNWIWWKVWYNVWYNGYQNLAVLIWLSKSVVFLVKLVKIYVSIFWQFTDLTKYIHCMMPKKIP
jgi:hypothetical protein